MRGKNIDIGSPSLLQKVKEISPPIHVFGHIHECYGIYTEKPKLIGDYPENSPNSTLFVNASNCGKNSVIVVDLEEAGFSH